MSIVGLLTLSAASVVPGWVEWWIHRGWGAVVDTYGVALDAAQLGQGGLVLIQSEINASKVMSARPKG